MRILMGKDMYIANPIYCFQLRTKKFIIFDHASRMVPV